MRSRPWPTPQQIAHAPELAVLCALDELFEIARRALIAAHPVLGDNDVPYCANDPSRLATAARALMASAEPLRRAIRAYNDAAKNHPEYSGDDDIHVPF